MSSYVKFSVLLVILLVSNFGDCKRKSARDTTTDDVRRRIEHPLVQALSPRGLRVSVPHFPGMELFAFHGNINAPIRQLESGSLSKDVLRTTNARWVFEDKTVQLRVGDVVNYWVFAQVNGVGHRVDHLSSIIRDLIPYDNNDEYAYVQTAQSAQSAPQPLPESDQLDIQPFLSKNPSLSQTTPVTFVPCAECNCNTKQLDDLNMRLNLTLAELNKAESKIAPLEKELSSLKALLEEVTSDLGSGTNLLLVGQQPPRGNALEAVRRLITDKLELFDLDEKIQSAQITGSGISFEMSSPLDKKRILVRAKKRLENSNFKIIDPNDRETLVSDQNLNNGNKDISSGEDIHSEEDYAPEENLPNEEDHMKKEVIPPKGAVLHQTTQHDIQQFSSQKPYQTTPATIPVCPECNCQKHDDIRMRINMTLIELKNVQSKVSPMLEEIKILKALKEEIAKDLSIGTKLLLVGQQPPRGNPLEAVRHLIADKLELFDLDEKIQSAQITGSGISFEMSSPLDKKRVLARAKNGLEKTSYKIIDPMDRETLVNGQYLPDKRNTRNAYRH